jgi:hypothetical protein
MAALTSTRILVVTAALLAAALPRAACAQMVGEGQPLPSEEGYGNEIRAPAALDQPVAERMAKAIAIASKAIARGYGQTCDLKAMPSRAQGYYPCVDIGPYRFVREYADASTRMVGYLVAGGEPFRFVESTGRATTLLVSGPWENDLLPRATSYDEDISGVTASRERALQPETRRVDAERRLRDFQSKEKSKDQPSDASAQPAPAHVPQGAQR